VKESKDLILARGILAPVTVRFMSSTVVPSVGQVNRSFRLRVGAHSSGNISVERSPSKSVIAFPPAEGIIAKHAGCHVAAKCAFVGIVEKREGSA
jgi:hypothetical protein